MKKLMLVLACAHIGCGTSSELREGRWTGSLTPMNHPDIANPIAYEVRYVENHLVLDLIGPGGDSVATDSPRLEGDSLFFSFNEPEEQVLLICALGRVESGGFAGRCSDALGKWAHFTMEPPGAGAPRH